MRNRMFLKALVAAVTAWTCLSVVPCRAGDGGVPSAETPRSEIPENHRWSLAVLFSGIDAWEKGFDALAGKIPELTMCQGKLGTSASETFACLDKLDGLRLETEALDAYAFQSWSVAMDQPKLQEIRDRVSTLSARIQETASFFDPELMKVDTARWAEMVKEKPELSRFNHPYGDLRRRAQHLLSPREEALVALTLPMRDGPYYVMNALMEEADFPKIRDEQGAEVKLGPATFPRYRGSLSRDVRKNAVEAYFATLKDYRMTLATSLATSVKGAVFEAKARGYASSLEMSLDADNVPVSVYENLLSTTAANLPRTLHRYVELRKKLMKLDAIHYYDLYNPLLPDFRKEIPYAEAVTLVKDSLKPMGADYLAILSQGIEPGSGWTDVYPSKAKQGGAYCNGVYGTHPFVLLNYMNELDDVFTTAHEFGHAMHFFLSGQSQPHSVADAPIFLAEIASTFQEEMLLAHLLKKATGKEERLVLLNKRLENIRLTITRQTMFAEFEKLIHGEVEKGGALTAERLGEIYRELIVKYFGPGFTIDPNDEMEWAYIPHFYYNFYVYKYSTGLMAAIVFSQRIQEGRKGAVQQFVNLLRAGGSDYPLSILQKSGIDFTSPEIVQSTYDLFARTIDEMEELLK